ncbi:MAG: POT family MFS transporter [Puniceicoccales bacterium]|jgi:POT family proton-dependent oligopeptide transporter|nr:POT family MFS transporter [Puniceicoccales bacterium]
MQSQNEPMPPASNPSDPSSTLLSENTAGRFPRQVPFILGNEACERFSFYGMRSVLATYLTSATVVAAAGSGVWPGLGMKEENALYIVHAFIAASYGSGLIGAWLADRFWGRYKTILYISLLYCAGHGILFLSDFSSSTSYKIWCLGAGLVLIAFGAGGIKPCVSSFMGDQFDPGQKRLIERAFGAFYWCINLGSFFAFLAIPYVRDHHGYGIAFAIPGILMAVATFVFWLGRDRYRHAPLATGPGFWKVFFFALTGREKRPGDAFWSAARRRFGNEKIAEISDMLRAIRPFLFIPPFWALYDQNSSTWIMQGNQMEKIRLGGDFVINADQIQAANPVLIMVLVPVFSFFLYPFFGKFATPLRRMGFGMFLAAVSFALVGWLQMRIEAGETLSLAWQLAPYVLLTAGEVLVSVTGLELSYTMAPKTMKSTVGSFWLLTVLAGQLIVMLVTKLIGAAAQAGDVKVVTSGRFFLFAMLLGATALVFALAMSFFKQDPAGLSNDDGQPLSK